jgi:hypothetical protein
MSVKDNYKDTRAEMHRDLNTNHLYPDDPPVVACAVYLKQWKLLKKKRQHEVFLAECKAKPGKRRAPSHTEKNRLFFKVTGKRNEVVHGSNEVCA